MKKLLSILLAAVMIFSMLSTTSVVTLAADGGVSTLAQEKVDGSFFDSILNFFETLFDSIDDFFADLFGVGLPDVSEWTDEDIIEYYKKAAKKTRFAKADRYFVDNGHSVTNLTPNDGYIGVLAIDEYMKAYMEGYYIGLNNHQIRGVMGDYKNLSVDDCKSIKVYTEGEYTVIELKFHNQYDTINDEGDKITLSHAMTDFGKLSPALSKITLLGITMKMPDVVADYTNATAKVRINPWGVVEHGTWYYDVVVVAKNVGGEANAPIDNISFDMTMDTSCTMTLGNGF